MTADIFSKQCAIVGGASMQSRRMGDTVQMMGEEKIERRPIAALLENLGPQKPLSAGSTMTLDGPND